MPTFFDALNELMAAETPLVAVTVVDTMGSAPQDRGAKMIVTAQGLHFGTVGGGKVETKALAEAQRMLKGEIADNTRFVQWNLAKDVGMTCGGIVKLYFEAHNSGRWRIVVFGAARLPTEVHDRFVCPIGLDIGTSHPYEIAIATIAQLIEKRDANRVLTSSFS